jgi:hypothetical protein
MAVIPICAENLHLMSNKEAGAIINAEIQAAVADLEDRGVEDGKPRKVAIELTLTLLDNGSVAGHVGAQAKLPPRRTSGTVARLNRKDGVSRALFNCNAPEDPDQSTIQDYLDGDERE